MVMSFLPSNLTKKNHLEYLTCWHDLKFCYLDYKNHTESIIPWLDTVIYVTVEIALFKVVNNKSTSIIQFFKGFNKNQSV